MRRALTTVYLSGQGRISLPVRGAGRRRRQQPGGVGNPDREPYHQGMASRSRFTLDEARAAGERIGVDWSSSPFDLEQFRAGMNVELEHGTRDPQTNVTDDDATMTAKIALAHLREFPDYYSRLDTMETEAEKKWAAQDE